MKPEDPGPLKDKKVREKLRAEWLPTIDKGIQNLERLCRSIPSTTRPWRT